MIYSQENLTEELRSEFLPLFQAHHKEVGQFKDIPISPIWDMYKCSQADGKLRIFTARLNDKLVGYAVYFVGLHPHSIDSVQALLDVAYVMPEHRGGKGEIFKWAESRLKAEGVEVVLVSMKKSHNFSSIMEALGYELVDLVYSKRVNERPEELKCPA